MLDTAVSGQSGKGFHPVKAASCCEGSRGKDYGKLLIPQGRTQLFWDLPTGCAENGRSVPAALNVWDITSVFGIEQI